MVFIWVTLSGWALSLVVPGVLGSIELWRAVHDRGSRVPALQS